MEEKFKELQMQLINDITCTETIISQIKDLVVYLKLGPKFFRELELTTTTLQELLKRTTETLDPKHLEQFSLSTRQVRMMAKDLLKICKKNMCSA